MFRLFKAELKKIFLKPSIFVVTGLIILMLAVSTFLYNPSTRSEYAINYSSFANKQTVNACYDEFARSTKSNADSTLQNALTYLDYYKDSNNAVNQLTNEWQKVQALFDTTQNDDYVSIYTAWEGEKTDSARKEALKNDLDKRKNKLRDAIVNFQSIYENYREGGAGAVAFLVTTDLDTKITVAHIGHMLDIINWSDNDKDDVHGYVINEFKSFEAFKKVYEDIDQLLPFIPSATLVNNLYPTVEVDGATVANDQSPIVIAKQRLIDINAKILEQKRKNGSKSDLESKENIIKYINSYYLTANYAYNWVVNSVKVSGLSRYSAIDITKFAKFENVSIYQLQEDSTKTEFKFKNTFDTNNFVYQNTADPFSMIQPSNTKINGFDYSYFALRLCTFFITIYIVVLAAGTIAGEQSAGTLKLLAIRPYSRNKLLSAKICAVLAIGAILIGVSSLASLVVGGVTYGFNFTNILAVFNSNKAFLINPLVLYFISMLTMFVEIMFYALLSVFISTVFKSNVGAVSIATLIFFISLVLNVISVNVPAMGLIPFVNVNFFKYFGSAFLANSGKNGLLQMILTPTVFAGSNFWISLLLYTLTTVIVVVVTHVIFNKRDIK